MSLRISMVLPWCFHGDSMGVTWCFRGSTLHPWRRRWGHIWECHETSTEALASMVAHKTNIDIFLGDFRGVSMALPWRLPWKFHGASMETLAYLGSSFFHGEFRVASVRRPLLFHESRAPSWGLPLGTTCFQDASTKGLFFHGDICGDSHGKSNGASRETIMRTPNGSSMQLEWKHLLASIGACRGHPWNHTCVTGTSIDIPWKHLFASKGTYRGFNCASMEAQQWFLSCGLPCELWRVPP